MFLFRSDANFKCYWKVYCRGPRGQIILESGSVELLRICTESATL